MRITNGMMTGASLWNVDAAFGRLATSQEQMSSGKRINRPSDDPAGASRALGLQNAIDRLEQYQANATEAQSFMGSTDTALSQAATLLRQARTLAVQGASDTIDQVRRSGFVPQLQSVIDSLATAANTTYGSRYVFAGQRTTTEPFTKDATGAWQYGGGAAANGSADVVAEIGPNETMVINQTGDTVFTGAFSALASLKEHLDSGDISAISQDDLKAIDEALTGVTGARAQVGARVQRLQQLTSAYSAAGTQYSDMLSKTVDVDIAQVVVEFQSAQVAYNGALSATKMSFQQSLLDFIK